MTKPALSAESKKPDILGFFSKIGTFRWLIIIAVLFLIVMIPMTLNFMNELSQQAVLSLRLMQLQTQYNDLKKTADSQGTLPLEVNQLKAESEALKAVYASYDNNMEISQTLLDLARENDITVTSISVDKSTGKIAEAERPLLSYTVLVNGQVAGFQNYFIALSSKLKASYISNLVIQPAQVQGELDQASMTINVYCNP